MKTLKFLIVLCFFVTTGLNTVKAQNRVIKETVVDLFSGCQYWDCLNEWIGATATVQFMYMNNKMSIKVVKFTVQGFIDECQTASTNVYEATQSYEANKSNTQNHMVIKQNGKLVGTYHYTLRVDEKTDEISFENEQWNCHL